MTAIVIAGIYLWPPDPLPYSSDGEPDTASWVGELIPYFESTKGRPMTATEKGTLETQALALYGVKSSASTTLNSADHTTATGGGTITGGKYSWWGDFHDNLEITSQERIDQGLALPGKIVDATINGAVEWVGNRLKNILPPVPKLPPTWKIVVYGGAAVVGGVLLYQLTTGVERKALKKVLG